MNKKSETYVITHNYYRKKINSFSIEFNNFKYKFKYINESDIKLGCEEILYFLESSTNLIDGNNYESVNLETQIKSTFNLNYKNLVKKEICLVEKQTLEHCFFEKDEKRYLFLFDSGKLIKIIEMSKYAEITANPTQIIVSIRDTSELRLIPRFSDNKEKSKNYLISRIDGRIEKIFKYENNQYLNLEDCELYEDSDCYCHKFSKSNSAVFIGSSNVYLLQYANDIIKKAIEKIKRKSEKEIKNTKIKMKKRKNDPRKFSDEYPLMMINEHFIMFYIFSKHFIYICDHDSKILYEKNIFLYNYDVQLLPHSIDYIYKPEKDEEDEKDDEEYEKDQEYEKEMDDVEDE